MPTIICLDGTFCEPGDAKVSLFDRGYLLGDSIFETLRVYGGAPFRLDRHLDRLEYAARVTGIGVPIGREVIVELVDEAIRRGGQGAASIRITVSRGEGPQGISPQGCDHPVLSIVVRELAGYPESAYRTGIRTKIVSARRVPAACLDPAIKCGNYLPGILARRELDADGMIEGVQLGVDGQIVCGTVSNVFLVAGRRLRTPDPTSGCLPGITRAAVLEIAASVGLEPVEERIEPFDLDAADEMFFANSIMECLPVAKCQLHCFGAVPGPATLAVHAALRALIARETGAAWNGSPDPSGVRGTDLEIRPTTNRPSYQ
jgi:branched-chain amino acid aminotransferase